MREAQKRYFYTTSPLALIEALGINAKLLEDLVDEELAREAYALKCAKEKEGK